MNEPTTEIRSKTVMSDGYGGSIGFNRLATLKAGVADDFVRAGQAEYAGVRGAFIELKKSGVTEVVAPDPSDDLKRHAKAAGIRIRK